MVVQRKKIESNFAFSSLLGGELRDLSPNYAIFSTFSIVSYCA